MPDGTLITVAPPAGAIGHLLRTAIDAEQVGATRVHLSAAQPDPGAALSALREQTKLIVTCGLELAGADVIRSGFVDAEVADDADLPALVADVARLVAAHPAGVGICGHGAAAVPALLAALAAGGHLWVGAPEPDDGRAVVSGPVRDQVALVARASGLARIAGRPPLDRQRTRRLLGVT